MALRTAADRKALRAEDLTQDSSYLTDEFYTALMESRRAVDDLGPATDAVLTAQCASLLHHEARLLDQHRYKEWLALFTADAIYWVPYDDSADVRYHVNLVFDDRRRLEDRVLRLLTAYAHAQHPGRSFQHVVSNVEAWEMPDGTRRALASQVAYEYRHGHEIARYVYRTDHTLRKVAGDWKIAVKRCVLLNMDAAMEPPTLL